MCQELSDDELVAREAEASMQGRTHNLLNQSVAAGYRNGSGNGAKSSLSSGSRDQSDGDNKVIVETMNPCCRRPSFLLTSHVHSMKMGIYLSRLDRQANNIQ